MSLPPPPPPPPVPGSLRTINCTSCGAGLSVLGGGRVESHVCGYCGALLDATDSYKVLAQYRDLPRPESPFRLGMDGEIKGVRFTVVGTVGWEERYEGKVWRWTDHMLFSQTHGYAWLSVEEGGHLTFSRKSRVLPSPHWIGPMTVETAESRPRAHYKGGRYRYLESGEAEITFLEGEFNWTPHLGDRSQAVTLVGDAGALTYRHSLSHGSDEREIEVTEYLPQAETLESFGVAASPARGFHPVKPFLPLPDAGTIKILGLGFAAAMVLTGVGLMTAGRTVGGPTEFRFADLPATMEFPLTEAGRLAEIRLNADVGNSWAAIEFEVYGPDDSVLFTTAREMAYYSGVENGERWSEGSRRAHARFRIPEEGTYRLEVTEAESENDWGAGRPAQRVVVTVAEGVYTTFWVFGAAALAGLLGAIPIIRRRLHTYRRDLAGDWDDD